MWKLLQLAAANLSPYRCSKFNSHRSTYLGSDVIAHCGTYYCPDSGPFSRPYLDSD